MLKENAVANTCSCCDQKGDPSSNQGGNAAMSSLLCSIACCLLPTGFGCGIPLAIALTPVTGTGAAVNIALATSCFSTGVGFGTTFSSIKISQNVLKKYGVESNNIFANVLRSNCCALCVEDPLRNTMWKKKLWEKEEKANKHQPEETTLLIHAANNN